MSGQDPIGADDLLMPVRTTLLAAIKHDNGVTALIPAASNYPGTVPANRTLPYSRFGTMTAAPLLATGLTSSAFRISFQAFSQDVAADGVVIRTAEDNVILIGSAFRQALDGKTFPIQNGMKARINWIQTSPTRDPTEASAWMTTMTFNAEVSG